MIPIWFPYFSTEAHRASIDGARLALYMYEYGIESRLQLLSDCVFSFCGSFFCHREFRLENGKYHHKIPAIYYCWDLYPFQLNGEEHDDSDYTKSWREYVEELKQDYVKEIWVPSVCTVDRVKEFTGKDAVVIKSSIRPFETSVESGGFVIDPMRDYPDPCRGWVSKACKNLKIPCVESKHLSLQEYRKAIGACRFMVTATHEASTGSLCLLEGYYHGKPVLLSNSPRNGGVDYFGDRATYFQHDSFDDLVDKIRMLWDNTPVIDKSEAQKWIETEYTDRCFASRLATRLYELR